MLGKQTKMTGVYILAKGFIEKKEATIPRTCRIFLGRYLTKEFGKHECKDNYGFISQHPGPGGNVKIIAISLNCGLFYINYCIVNSGPLIFRFMKKGAHACKFL